MRECSFGFHPWLCIRVTWGATKSLKIQASSEIRITVDRIKAWVFFKGTKVKNHRTGTVAFFFLTGFQRHTRW